MRDGQNFMWGTDRMRLIIIMDNTHKKKSKSIWNIFFDPGLWYPSDRILAKKWGEKSFGGVSWLAFYKAFGGKSRDGQNVWLSCEGWTKLLIYDIDGIYQNKCGIYTSWHLRNIIWTKKIGNRSVTGMYDHIFR